MSALRGRLAPARSYQIVICTGDNPSVRRICGVIRMAAIGSPLYEIVSSPTVATSTMKFLLESFIGIRNVEPAVSGRVRA